MGKEESMTNQIICGRDTNSINQYMDNILLNVLYLLRDHRIITQKGVQNIYQVFRSEKVICKEEQENAR